MHFTLKLFTSLVALMVMGSISMFQALHYDGPGRGIGRLMDLTPLGVCSSSIEELRASATSALAALATAESELAYYSQKGVYRGYEYGRGYSELAPLKSDEKIRVAAWTNQARRAFWCSDVVTKNYTLSTVGECKDTSAAESAKVVQVARHPQAPRCRYVAEAYTRENCQQPWAKITPLNCTMFMEPRPLGYLPAGGDSMASLKLLEVCT